MGFEQLEVWKRSSKLCTEIYKHFNNLKDFGFRDQITRSSLSIPSNIAEGEERGTIKENVQFLIYARGSCGELRTQIYKYILGKTLAILKMKWQVIGFTKLKKFLQ